MNSLLGGVGNILANAGRAQASIANKQQMPNILLQAIGAALRGEDAHSFMQNLAMQHPELKQYDLSNLSQTAQQVCQQNNVDVQSAINQIDNIASTIIK